MSSVRVCTFNVENLFVRYRTFGFLPADTKKKEILSPQELEERGGFLPGRYWKNSFEVFDKKSWRKLTAGVLEKNAGYPDILCLQEIESMRAIRRFNEDYMKGFYDNIVLIDGNDPRLINVAILTKDPIKIGPLVTHIHDRDRQNMPLFSRDCLEVDIDLDGTATLTLYINHLKSKYAMNQQEADNADKRRLEQATKAAELIKERFGGSDFDKKRFAVVGDFNDHPESPWLKPLVQDLGLENVVTRIADEDSRWTHWWASKNLVSQLDFILVSKKISNESPNPPYIERSGLCTKRKTTCIERNGTRGKRIRLEDIERLDGVTEEISASDHCPLFFTVNY